MTATLRHVTANTGHVRRSPRSEVDPAVFRTVGPLLTHTDGRHQALPAPLSAWRLSATSQDDALIATLWVRHSGSDVPALTFAVAGDAAAAGLAWSALADHAAQMRVENRAERPATPWVVTVLLPTLGTLPEAMVRDGMAWAADFQRCVAWAWLLRRGQVDE